MTEEFDALIEIPSQECVSPDDDNFVLAITDLARRTGQSKAEVLRDAVNLYHRAVNEWGENNKGIVFQVPPSKLVQDNTTSTQNAL